MSKKKPVDAIVFENVVAAIRSADIEGCPVAARAMDTARAAVRRWRSSARRGVRQENRIARVKDLAKGLAERFEPKGLIGPLIVDYRYLAERIAEVIQSDTASNAED